MKTSKSIVLSLLITLSVACSEAPEKPKFGVKNFEQAEQLKEEQKEQANLQVEEVEALIVELEVEQEALSEEERVEEVVMAPLEFEEAVEHNFSMQVEKMMLANGVSLEPNQIQDLVFVSIELLTAIQSQNPIAIVSAWNKLIEQLIVINDNARAANPNVPLLDQTKIALDAAATILRLAQAILAGDVAATVEAFMEIVSSLANFLG